MKDKTPIRVMIVDDHQMVRRGLGLFLRGYDDLLVVGEADNGEDAYIDEFLPKCWGASVRLGVKSRGDEDTALLHALLVGIDN